MLPLLVVSAENQRSHPRPVGRRGDAGSGTACGAAAIAGHRRCSGWRGCRVHLVRELDELGAGAQRAEVGDRGGDVPGGDGWMVQLRSESSVPRCGVVGRVGRAGANRLGAWICGFSSIAKDSAATGELKVQPGDVAPSPPGRVRGDPGLVLASGLSPKARQISRGACCTRLAGEAWCQPIDAGYMVQVFRTSAFSFHAVIAASRMSLGLIGLTPSIMSISRMP